MVPFLIEALMIIINSNYLFDFTKIFIALEIIIIVIIKLKFFLLILLIVYVFLLMIQRLAFILQY